MWYRWARSAPPTMNLGAGRGHRRAHVHEIQLRIEARHHPGADMPPLLERHVAPRFVPRLAGRRDQPRPPQFLAGFRVVRRDDAGKRPAARIAAPTGDHLAVGDDRPRGLVGRVHLVVENLRLPDHLARLGVQGEDVIVHAGVDDQLAVDGDVAVDVEHRADHVVGKIIRPFAVVLPEQVAGHRIDRLDDVARIGHVHDVAAHEGRALLAARRQCPRPDQPKLTPRCRG